MVRRPLLYLLFAVLAGAGAYWTVVVSLGGLGDDPFRRLATREVWPVPPDAAAHPFWARFPALRGADRGERHEAWQALLAFDRSAIPHPNAKPRSWPLEQRVFARALLWRLWRGRSFRAGGLELRLDREENAPPPRVGEPARLRLAMVSIAGAGRARFPRDLRKLLDAGAELRWFTQPPGGLPPVPLGTSAGDPPPRDDEPTSVRRTRALDAPHIGGAPFRSAGRLSVRVLLDLTRAEVENERVPRGLWLTDPLVLDVAPAE